ncbi:hypothetical protein BOX15_Mlig026557g1 [Macrostomum lignano]|uniref:Innexin n=2 Tax=Macrostomum lignano TaxID=282301 RepID=A0A1I8GIV8_9PLAT|nr:hypothetical protein BOX15_Mlig026557g3 [Macrostomum lignano]PAA94055.1 hypothetical protein BOX15_Mlig026557g1 [Macrostomum lignano]
MVADQFISYAQKWGLGRTANLNDYADKFNYLLMPIVLILFVSLTTLRQYVFQPIVCEAATTPSSTNFADYINNLCWVEGTYTEIDFESAKLRIDEEFWAKQRKSLYYQWVPFTLALQATMFFLPRLMWLAYVHNRAGPDLEALLESASEANKAVDWQLRQSLISGIGRSLDYMLRMRQSLQLAPRLHDGYKSRRNSIRQCLSRRPSGCLTIIYALIKLLFMVNALCQMYIMGLMLDPDSPDPFLFGFRLITALRSGADWRATRYFPRVTLCRVLIRQIGARNMYAAQCILPLNMLSEKIYCFLWVASAVGASLSCLSLLQWALRLTCGHGRWRHHLRRYLLMGTDRSRHANVSQQSYDFADHLDTDGLFLVHMIRLNVGELIACDVTNSLYSLWLERMYPDPMEAGEPAAEAESCAV